MDQNEIAHDPRHLGVPSGVSETISKPMVRSAQIVHLSCVKTSTVSNTDWTELPFDPHHLEVPLGASKWFLSLWYVWRKPYTYLAPILTLSSNGLKRDSTRPTLILSPNGPKRDYTWHTSPRSSIGCIPNDFQAYGTFGANRGPNLHRH
jgi:hypothetical protein